MSLRGNKCIAILREIKNKWERRAPLAPQNVAQLVNKGIRVLIQPCSRRVYTNSEYERVGAEVISFFL